MDTKRPSSASAWEPPSPERLQSLLPQYEIAGILGRGGMGAVYEGRQAKLNRRVAIKVLPETFTQGEDELNFAKRFEQEAQAMAGLDHPAIISVHDFGETSEGQLYIVMEFVDGMDVQRYLVHHGGRLPVEYALSIIAHVLDALDYAHGHGIVHRDIKPANILLNREGRVKVADFGLAKKFGDEVDSPALTMTDMAVGTPHFVAPEVLEGNRPLDHRADLYAVGVMLYQMLTGTLPRGNYQTPSELDPGLDPRLDAIVEKAMAANPDFRYPDAGAIREDLDSLISQPLAKVEAGAQSGAVDPAVPATTSLRETDAHLGDFSMPQARDAKPSAALLYGGIGVTFALAVALLFLATRGGKEEEPSSQVGTGILSSDEAEETEPMSLASAQEAASPSSSSELEPEAQRGETVVPPAIAEPMPAELVPIAVLDPDSGRTEGINEIPMVTDESIPETLGTATADGMIEAHPAPLPQESSDQTVPPASDIAPQTETPLGDSALASIPGFSQRLEAYLSMRRERTSELATSYLRGLESRLGSVVDAGDLPLALAYREEKVRVRDLQDSLAQPASGLFDLVSAGEDLDSLPENVPGDLANLRSTWTDELGKIREALDSKLVQSLQALEGELTRARDFESAAQVMAFREGAGLSLPSLVAAPAEPVENAEAASVEQVAGLRVPATATDDPRRATKDEPFENSLGMRFVPVPGTEVLFCIHETRWRDYAVYAERNPGVDSRWMNQTHDGFVIEDRPEDRPEDHPVAFVNWWDARAFCEWLSREERRVYRLPTDEEWSHAVGLGRMERRTRSDTPKSLSGGVDHVYPWGRSWPPPSGAGNYSDESRRERAPTDRSTQTYVFEYDDGFPTTAPVMSFQTNEFGLYDLGGNVWEWVEEFFSDEQDQRAIRGSAWDHGHRGAMRSSYRTSRSSDSRHSAIGFRVVLDLESPQP